MPCCLGGEHVRGPRSALQPSEPTPSPKCPQETPPLRLLYQRQEAGPKPREGTTQTAIISSLAKTSNSPNYPGKEKKTQNENKLTCLHRSCCSNTHKRARTHALVLACALARLSCAAAATPLPGTYLDQDRRCPSDQTSPILAGHGLRLLPFGFFYLSAGY